VEHPKKTLKDLKSTWIVGHIKVLRTLRETYKSACNSSHKSKNNGLKHLKHLCKKIKKSIATDCWAFQSFEER
jgi:hypothetical protein